MRFGRLSLSLLLVPGAVAQQTTLEGTNAVATGSLGDRLPTGTEATYASYESTQTVSSEDASDTAAGSMIDASSIMAASKTSTQTGSSSTSSVTLLQGSSKPTTTSGTNGTATSTSSSVIPTNTQACNGWAEFCARNFSNITYVAAHNSPFIIPNSAASNQALDVETQLNDGIRMLQFQSHYENSTMYLCHSSCSLLNAGTLESYLTTVRKWLQGHPYEVITILIGNYDYVDPSNYTAPFTDSGLLPYLYTPPKIPMAVSDWPTLSEMILRNKRVVTMLDYMANQTAVPWLMDEFGQMWETPFSPTNRSFPCTADRPPEDYAGALPRTNRMYMANHNLNVNISVGSYSILVPGTTILNETNAVDGYGSLGVMARTCLEMWDRPPNFLLVDYYNYGSPFNGSVFQVAANMNNVTYNPMTCCGDSATRSSAPGRLTVEKRRSLQMNFALSIAVAMIIVVIL